MVPVQISFHASCHVNSIQNDCAFVKTFAQPPSPVISSYGNQTLPFPKISRFNDLPILNQPIQPQTGGCRRCRRPEFGIDLLTTLALTETLLEALQQGLPW